MTYVEAVMFEMAARDNVVLVGLASTIILGKVPQALRVRVTAPARTRAARVEQGLGLTHEASIDYVHRTDTERAARVKFLYDVDWDDPLLYDLALNTERLDADSGARVVRETLQHERFQSTAASRKAVMDLSLSVQAKAALVANPGTQSSQLFASARDGYVSLSGIVRDEQTSRTAEEIVRRIPGVSGVVNEIAVAPVRPGTAVGL
jgi:hypothetical protein